ncbi:hypothetical protein CAEBREN_30040 [Caenorhabditis brenneri]|uniref:Uncharacterized protein n=1 Tax=Caenorhabditis brenneri TaxID=135651 RepID=G0NY47_CAEBE|nr:hypothetical protein CAEBREN_30040 [Caenorhabditis brenneri]
MNHYLAGCLLLAVSLGSILPGFPILILLQSYFPELPAFYTIDTLAVYLVQASIIFLLGFISMCIYSDIACPLAIKGYVAIFSRIYILLEDLESWYSDGLVTLEDHIQVYEDGGRRMGCYTIRNLIEIYGVEFPFRRVPRELISAPDPSNNIPLLSSNPGIILDRSKVNYLKKLFIYVNPDELRNEEGAWPKLLNSVVIPKRCLGCKKPIPKEPYRLARHIFSEAHLTKLGEVSDKDYEFWMDIHGRDTVVKSKGPLLSFPEINEELCTKHEFNRARKEMNEAMKQLGNLFIEKMNYTAPLEELNFWKDWLKEQMSKINDKRSLAQKVEDSVQPPVPNMKENLSETQKMEAELDVFSMAKTLISFSSEQGMPKLPEMGGAKTNLSGKQTKNPTTEAKAQNRSSNTKFQSIPLLLSYSGPNFDKTKIDNLTKLYFEADKSMLESEQGYWTRFLKSMKIPERCPLCNNEQLSKKPSNLAKHILNEKHLSALKGIPDAEYECWVQLLSLSTVAGVEQDVVQATESIATKMIVEALSNTAGPQADNVADKSQNTLAVNTPEVKKPLEAVSDAQKPSYKEVPKAPVAAQGNAEKRNLLKTVPTVKNSPEPSKDTTNTSKKTNQVPLATGPSIVTLVSTVAQNKPRVPLLDPMLPKETSVSKEKFNNVLDECLDLYKKDRSRFDVGKKSMHFQASAADLNHWMRYLLEINKDTAEPSTGKQKHNAKQEVFKRPASGFPVQDLEIDKSFSDNPRVPLLDVPASQGKLMPQDAFKSRYNGIREQFQALNISNEANQKLECYCYHCPGRPKFATVYSSMQHVFDGLHCENIMFSAMSSDFDYYEDLMKRMAPVPRKEPAKKTPVSIVNPTPKLSKNLIECDLPLFLTQQKMARRTDGTCIGPTNSQIVYIGRLVRNPQMAPIRFRDNTICGICNVVISSWVAIEVVRHVFSTEHLHALKQTGTQFYISDFDFWIAGLIADNTLLYPPHFLGTTLPVVSCLGGLKYMNCYANDEVFKKFSSQELIMINNLDEWKVHSRAESLLRTKGSESKQSIPATTELALSFSVETPQVENSVNLGGYNYLDRYDEYKKPLYLTKEKLGPRNGTVCSGPPNAHIDFLRKAKPKNRSLLPKATDKWRQITGTPLYSEDFEDTMTYLRIQLGRIGHECSSNCTTLTHLGVFLEFTPEEKAMLENLDQKKVESQAMSLLQNFGGCIYCNQWFVSGKEVIEHFTSDSHFANIRKKEPVKRSYVTCIMEYVRRCQKDPWS